LIEEDRIGELAHAGGAVVEQQRLVVAALRLPVLDRLGGHALGAELHARHVVRRVDDEEQQEGQTFTPTRIGIAYSTRRTM
jgi:hypothetical protein